MYIHEGTDFLLTHDCKIREQRHRNAEEGSHEQAAKRTSVSCAYAAIEPSTDGCTTSRTISPSTAHRCRTHRLSSFSSVCANPETENVKFSPSDYPSLAAICNMFTSDYTSEGDLSCNVRRMCGILSMRSLVLNRIAPHVGA
jgi:hypothetical protein